MSGLRVKSMVRTMPVFLALSAVVCVVGCDRLGGSKQESQPAAATTPKPSAPNTTMAFKPVDVPPSDILATVNGQPISKEDLRLRLQELRGLVESVGQEWKTLSQEELGAVLQELINNELMKQAALKADLDKKSEVRQRFAFVRRGFYAQEWLRSLQSDVEVSDQEVQNFYETNKEGFRNPEQIRLRQLVVSTEQQAKQALSQLLSGNREFKDIALEISEGDHASSGGLLPEWVMRQSEIVLRFASAADAEAAGVISLSPKLEAAAFAIDRETGLSNYVQGEDGNYYIFQLEEREQGEQRSLAEVQSGIRNALAIQKLQQQMQNLVKTANIQKFPDRMQMIEQ